MLRDGRVGQTAPTSSATWKNPSITPPQGTRNRQPRLTQQTFVFCFLPSQKNNSGSYLSSFHFQPRRRLVFNSALIWSAAVFASIVVAATHTARSLPCYPSKNFCKSHNRNACATTSNIPPFSFPIPLVVLLSSGPVSLLSPARRESDAAPSISSAHYSKSY